MYTDFAMSNFNNLKVIWSLFHSIASWVFFLLFWSFMGQFTFVYQSHFYPFLIMYAWFFHDPDNSFERFKCLLFDLLNIFVSSKELIILWFICSFQLNPSWCVVHYDTTNVNVNSVTRHETFKRIMPSVNNAKWQHVKLTRS